jgi:carnitine 3-dehydrogenase
MAEAARPGISTAAVIGGGVIGAGWVARLVRNGIDVQLYDTTTGTAARVEAVVAHAERAWAKLTMAPRGRQGSIRYAPTIAEAVTDAGWLIEAVPERLELKHAVYAEIEAIAAPEVPIASSTSGILPSDLQAPLRHPERLLVAHPFNPVYLLPLVEIVGGTATDPGLIDRASAFYDALGMYPLHVRREIPAFIADRLLEALWRESLWLIKDGICTTQELDDAVRFGFGLRYAQMGVFETYRIAGGEAGMRHFLAQFGPCLAWPWTRLTDVPDLDPDLVETIAGQSDAQSGAHSIAALERLRDDNLVGILQALKANDWGAGQTLRRHERRLYDAAAPAEEPDLTRPIRTLERLVPPEWADYNNHMNEAHYLTCFCDASDALMRLIGADADYLAQGGSYFTVETHIRHLAEARVGEPIRALTRVIDGSGKRLHLFHELFDSKGECLATGEHMLLHVSLETRRASAPGPTVRQRLDVIASHHARLPKPAGLGRAVGDPR